MPFRAYTQATRTAAAWLKTPAGGLTLLILATFVARLFFASALGLGVDESYMVATGRKLQLSYFDHPPISWWMAWAAAHLFGSDNPFVVRLPFIALFAVTTFLMYRLTSALFGSAAGFYAAVVLNVAPVFGISTATWVLPDGPLLAALLGGAICLIAALDSQGRTAWSWWLGAGACAGLALCSKYSAALAIIGLVLFLLTEPRSRHWLMQPHPYAAGLLALAIFLPVLIWNAEHEWVSFLFQGSRANGAFHALGLVSTLAGGAAYLLPWIWAPLIICGFIAIRRGPHDRERWLLVCLALPPIVVFAAAAPWGNVLFHWAAPGYLMLLPLLGDAIARHWRDSRLVRSWLTATGAFVVVGVTLFASNVKFNWLASLIGDVRLGRDASVGAVDWTSLRRDFAERGFLKRPGLVVAALRWSDAAKIDYALGGSVPVICLCRDAREYGLIARHDDYVGADVLIVARSTFEKMIGQCRPLFDALDPIAPAIVTHADRPALELPLFLGHRLHAPADVGCAF